MKRLMHRLTQSCLLNAATAPRAPLLYRVAVRPGLVQAPDLRHGGKLGPGKHPTSGRPVGGSFLVRVPEHRPTHLLFVCSMLHPAITQPGRWRTVPGRVLAGLASLAGLGRAVERLVATLLPLDSPPLLAGGEADQEPLFAPPRAQSAPRPVIRAHHSQALQVGLPSFPSKSRPFLTR